jgi:hypothetical protein
LGNSPHWGLTLLQFLLRKKAIPYFIQLIHIFYLTDVRLSAAATAAKLFMRIVPHVPARASRLAFTRGYFLKAATAALSR